MQDKIKQLNQNNGSTCKNKKITIIAVITAVALLICGGIGVTYAFFTSNIRATTEINFGNLAVAVDYTDNTKQHTSFALSGVETITPGQEVPVLASISSARKSINDLEDPASASSYLRFRIVIEGFEDERLTTSVDSASQQALDYVAQNISIASGVTTWTKGADGYIYYTGNSTASRKLEWLAGKTESLAGNIILNFPEADFSSGWGSRFIRLTLEVQTYQYKYLEINYSSCADTFDMVNCASSIINDYNFSTGLATNVCAVRTSYCSTSTKTFKKGAQATLSNFAGNTSSLRIYSAGKKLALTTNYTVSGSTVTVKNNATANSLFLVCSQMVINLADSTDSSVIYQTIYGKQDGTLPLKVAVPSKENVSFFGYYTAVNGGGTKIYDESGNRVVSSTSSTVLYAHFISADATLAYRDTIKAYQGDTAFTQAFEDSQKLDTLSASITIFRDFSLSKSYPVTTTGMELTIKSVKKANNDYCDLSFTGLNYNCFSLTSSYRGNTICFENINLIAPSGVANMRAISSEYSNVTIHGNVTFENFSVNGGEGSAIRCHYANVTIQGENTLIPDVVFKNCSSYGDGGAIKTDQADVQIVNAKFDSCSAGVNSSNSGGAIATWRSTILLENSTFTNNSSTNFAGACYIVASSTLTIVSGLFDSNKSKNGGGVFFMDNATRAYIKGGTFTNNKSESHAGGVFFVNNNAYIAITGGTFGDASKTACATATSYSNYAYLGGGVLSVETGSSCEIYSTKTSCPLFAYNYGGDSNINRTGGAFRVLNNGTLHVYKGDGATSSPEIRYNYACRGGAIFAMDTLTTGTESAPTSNKVILEGCYIHHNEAVYGGAYYCRSANVNNLSTLQIKDGALLTANHATTAYGCVGGALGSITMSGGTISNNVSANGGSGGVCLDVSGSTITMSGGEIKGNSATSYGGGISVVNGVTFTMTGGKVLNNTSATHGGGIHCRTGSNIYITGGEVSGNKSNIGGGIFTSSNNTNISNITIKNNTATTKGGGFSADKNVVGTLANCLIDGNKTEKEAGGGMLIDYSKLAISDIILSNNTAYGYGGGCYINDQACTFSGSITATGNIAQTGRGGGIYLVDSSRTGEIVFNCNFVSTNNSSPKDQGGGFSFQYINANATAIVLKSAIISGNTANIGGGIRVGWDSAPLVLDGENIRIYNNKSNAGAGGIFLESWNNGNNNSYTDDHAGKLIMNAGYIYDNTATTIGGGIYVSCGNNVPDSYAGAQGSVTINGGEIYGNSCGTYNITTSSPINRGGGGAIFASNWAQVTINGGKIYGNSTTATGTSNTDYGGGGGIHMSLNSRLTINGGQIGGDTFSNANKATNGFGGAIMLANTSTCVITGGIIGSNKATTYATKTACANIAKSGGGIWVGPQARLTIESDENQNPSISWNVSTLVDLKNGGGAGIKNNTTTLTINANKTSFDTSTAVLFKYNTSEDFRGSAIYAGTSTIKNCIIANNKGGVVRTKATMDYCRFTDNSGDCLSNCEGSVIKNTIISGTIKADNNFPGNAVYTTSITMENCEINNNVKGLVVKNATINNCNIHDNINSGIELINSGNSIISNSTIASHQNSTIAGSGIYVHYNATAKIINCIISDNVGTFGSAVYNEGAYVEIQGCNINNNKQTRSGAVTALSTTVSNVTYNAQTYITGLRGTELLNTSDLTGWTSNYNDRFTSSYDSTNKVTTVSCASSGGWEEYYKSVSLTAGKTYLISVDYENVTAQTTDSFDKAYIHKKYGLKMQLLKSTPTASNNSSLEAGGGDVSSTFANTGELINTKSRMFIEWTCNATGTYYINFNFGSLRDGQTHTVKLKNLVVSEYTKGSSTIVDNNQRISAETVAGYGGAGISNGSLCPMGLHNVTVSNNTNNISNSSAGIISDFGIQISACNIFGNTSTEAGSGLKLGAGNTDTIISGGSNFYNNTTTVGDGGAIATSGNSPIAIIGANIYNNKQTGAGHNGGGIRTYSNLHLIAVNLYGNTTVSHGGAICINNGALTIHAGAIIGGTNAQTANKASGDGGGIWTSGAVTMYGGCIGNPNATEHATQTAYGNYAVYGGGIVLRGGSFTMRAGSINYNWANGNSGGLCSGWPTKITGGEIAYNGSVEGGGINIFGSSATLELSNANIHHNYATSAGGGLTIWEALKSTAIMTSGNIYANEAVGHSAGIRMRDTSSMTMSGGNVYNNVSKGYGGGVGIGAKASMVITGGIIRDNECATNGGGVAVYGIFTMSAGTITGNKASQNGGGVWKASSATSNITGGTITGNLPQDTFNATA